jgi:hypothetical protein
MSDFDGLSDVSESPEDAPELLELTDIVSEPTDEEQAAFDGITKLVKKVAPILEKIGQGASRASNAPSIRIKAKDAYYLMDWIVTLQNIGDLQSQQLESAKAVIGSQHEALQKYETQTGKKLWTPGPV